MLILLLFVGVARLCGWKQDKIKGLLILLRQLDVIVSNVYYHRLQLPGRHAR